MYYVLRRKKDGSNLYMVPCVDYRTAQLNMRMKDKWKTEAIRIETKVGNRYVPVD